MAKEIPIADTTHNHASPRSHKAPARCRRREFYTTKQIAELLQVRLITIYRMARRGDIPFYRIGRAMRFRHQDVEAFVRRCRGVPRPD